MANNAIDMTGGLDENLSDLEKKLIRQDYRKIPNDVLQTSMRVVVPELQGASQNSHSLFYLINNQNDIDKLLNLGVREVWIKKDHIPPSVQSALLFKEIKQSKDFYNNSKQAIELYFDNIRAGEVPPISELNSVVDNITSSVVKHPTALLCMKGLQDAHAYTYFHSINVALLSSIFANFLGYSQEEIREITLAALLHDLGKQKISLEILNAPRKLSSAEFKIMQMHPIYALEILKDNIELSTNVYKAILEHHERYDGTGYPRKLSKNEIHPFASIISISDVYDALTSERAYKKAIPQNKTAAYIYTQKNLAFPPEITELFIRCFGVYPIGTLVKINATQFAIVCENNKDDLLSPKVLELTKRGGKYTFSSLEPIDLRLHKDKYKITACENFKWDHIQLKDLVE